MSVRQGMLALLAEEPMHCYHVRQRFEERTGGTWPLNIGQVYTTVQRLVRDGLVEVAPDGALGAREPTDDDGPARQGGPQPSEHYRLTGAGRATVEAWWMTPVVRGTPSRDELAIKVALAVTAPGVDVRAIIQTQRTETMRALRDYTRLAAEQGLELTWALVLDNLVFTTEAEIRWLDHVEARIARASSSSSPSLPASSSMPRASSEAGPQGGSASPKKSVTSVDGGGTR